jgi:hypothetical protein
MGQIDFTSQFQANTGYFATVPAERKMRRQDAKAPRGGEWRMEDGGWKMAKSQPTLSGAILHPPSSILHFPSFPLTTWRRIRFFPSPCFFNVD